MPVKLSIGENIRKVRLRKGLSQRQVAEACGTVDATIRSYELGRANPKPVTVAKIANALEVSVAELYGVDWTGAEPTATDGDTASAVYQAMVMQYDDISDADKVRRGRLLAAYEKLNDAGKDEAVRRLEEMSQLPTYLSEFDPFAFFSLREREQLGIACRGLQEARLERKLMQEDKCKSQNAMDSNTRMIADAEQEISDIILAVFGRSRQEKNG